MQRFGLGALVVATLTFQVVSTPLLGQDVSNETSFVQGSERYPARVLPGRIAVVLSNNTVEDASRFREALTALRAMPEPSLPPNVVSIEVPNLREVEVLGPYARDIRASRPDLIADSGILVAIGKSELPFVVTDKIIVQLTDDTPPATIDTIADEFEVEIISPNPFDKQQFVVQLKSRDPAHTLRISNAINARAGVKFAHPNFYRAVERRQMHPVVNDTYFPDQWHLINTRQGNGTLDADVDIDRAWAFGLGSPSIMVAVIDDGFELNHQDLAPNLWVNSAEATGVPNHDDDQNDFIDDVNGWDFTTCQSMAPCGDEILTPASADLHGTATAGAAIARGNNGIGVAGTCPQCTFLPIRALNSSDFGRGLAFGYAVSKGADVISNSWGYPLDTFITASVVEGINDAATAGRNGLGAVVLFAMGNDSGNNCADDPARDGPADISSLPNVIAVSRATNEDTFFPGGFGTCMDVLGPTSGGTRWGVTTDRQGNTGYNSANPLPGTCPTLEAANKDYTFCFKGTSFATPVTAGVAGLILSLDGSLTRLQVQQILQDTADKISDSTGTYSEQTGFSTPATTAIPSQGYGRINAFEATKIVAPLAAGGRGGMDLYFRDNRLDWGNTEQPSNVTFEAVRGFIPHWQSVDIKVDAPPFDPNPPTNSTAFSAFAHEDPLSTTVNRVYVRVHNRGPRPATAVTVKLHWAFAGAGLPALPADFWSVFPSDSSDVSIWHPLQMQTVASVPYSGASVSGGSSDGSVVLTFDFAAPVYDATLPNPDHYCLLAIADSSDDPVQPSSSGPSVPDLITPSDNNVTHRNVQLLNSGRSNLLQSRIFLSNPFTFPITTKLLVWSPKNWTVVAEGLNLDKTIELGPGNSLPVTLSFLSETNANGSIDVVQVYNSPETKREEVLGGTTYEVTSENVSFDPNRPKSDLLELIRKHQASVDDYQKLLTNKLSKGDVSESDQVLLDRLGKILEDQGRLLRQ